MAESFGGAIKEGGPVVTMSRMGGIPQVFLIPGRELQALELLDKLGVIKIGYIQDGRMPKGLLAVGDEEKVG